MPGRSASTSEAAHILVVDDDPEIGALLARYLGGHGYRVSIAGNGAGLRQHLGKGSVDLVLLDLGLPDGDGLGLLREFQVYWHGPVIVVSGRGESIERVVGLELGADDYVSKPFDLRELLARVRSVLRRAQSHRANDASAGPIEFGGLRLETSARRLLDRDGIDLGLTSGEFDLLLLLLKRPNQVLTRDQLMSSLHGRDAGPYDRSIDVQIGRLRRKIEADPARPRVIKSIRGAGYMLAASVSQA